MDNNFWISAAIAAVVGGAWLFKKGKSAYSLEKYAGLLKAYV